jgi:AcrR family transcriptional regulator
MWDPAADGGGLLMVADFSGGGDPRRSIALLWGLTNEGRRGPKPRRSADEVVQAAIAIADAEGLAAVSMRRVADALGLSPMSLYTYVPSKAELLDLMLDRVAAEVLPPDAPDWRGKLEQLARDRWRLVQRHPWLAQVSTHRPPLGPNVLAQAEATLSAIAGLGLSELEMDQVTQALTDYVRGAVRAAIEAREVVRATGVTDEQWWALNQPLLKDRIEPSDYPTIVRVGQALASAAGPPFDPERSFEFGLQRMLDGVAVFIAARRAEDGTA